MWIIRNSILPRLLFCVLSLGAESVNATLSLKTYLKKPKLVVFITVDQLRSDFLPRMAADLLPAKANGNPGGFRFLMEDSAYFPQAEYDIMQSMTCPGHAMLLTGSRPARLGIPLNVWFDRASGKDHYCATDAVDGLSPRALKSTTVSDEFKNSMYSSKVIGLAIKDRSGIMMAGHRADLVLWLDKKSLRWTTSTFYSKGSLPQWVDSLNQEIAPLSESETEIFGKKYKMSSERGLGSKKGVELTFRAAESAFLKEKLGQENRTTDFLFLSLSPHDIAGHWFGPNSPELREVTLAEDRGLAQLFKTIQSKLNLKDVVFVLTSDHGVAPTAEESTAVRIPSEELDYDLLEKIVNDALTKSFGKTKSGKPWVQSSNSFHFYLNDADIAAAKLDKSQVESEAAKALSLVKGVRAVVTSSNLAKGIFPIGISPNDKWGQQIHNQYVFGKSGDLVLLPEPFYFEKDEKKATHMTGYSYDTIVPLIFKGSMFKPGIHAKTPRIIDIAPTLSFLLGTTPPSLSEGRVLDEIFY